MELVLLTGLQASGKSTFCRERFFRTHLRINLDMINTRHREERLMQVCFETQLPFVVDNTNVTRSDRERYIALARQHKFRVIGYYFQSKIHDCIARNEQRTTEEQVPKLGLLGASNRLELPSLDEGFDELYYVQIDPETKVFLVEQWGGTEQMNKNCEGDKL